jgi:hypothetical protein
MNSKRIETQGEFKETKDIDNLYNNIIAENFSSLNKERDIKAQEAFTTPNCQDQKICN